MNKENLVLNDEKIIKEKDEEEEYGLMIKSDDLDKGSSYSLIYLATVYFDEVEEMNQRIRKIWDRLSKNDKSEKSEKKFQHELEDLDLKIKYDPDEEDMKKYDILYKFREPFIHSLIVAIISAAFQLIITVSLIIYYKQADFKVIQDTMGHYVTRIICFFVAVLNVYGEFENGKKIIMHGINQKEIYRSTGKRFISIFFGLLQATIANICVICNSMFMISSEKLPDTIKNFAAFLVLINIDNYIGGYFLENNRRLQKYIGGGISQITVMKAKDYFSFTFVGTILELIYLGSTGFGLYLVLQSIGAIPKK